MSVLLYSFIYRTKQWAKQSRIAALNTCTHLITVLFKKEIKIFLNAPFPQIATVQAACIFMQHLYPPWPQEPSAHSLAWHSRPALIWPVFPFPTLSWVLCGSPLPFSAAKSRACLCRLHALRLPFDSPFLSMFYFSSYRSWGHFCVLYDRLCHALCYTELLITFLWPFHAYFL